jgi:hypothetical protein
MLVVVDLTLLVGLLIATPVWVRGRLGHRVISRIAEKNVNPKAKAAITDLLEPDESLADTSTWADEHRRQLPKTAPWHYVDVPLDEPRYDSKFSGDVPAKGCVVDKANEFRLTLKDPARSVEDRRFALRFLITLRRGSPPALPRRRQRRQGRESNPGAVLRSRDQYARVVWDTLIIEHVSKSESFWLEDLAALDTAENRAAWTKGSVEDWATESLMAARQAYQVPETGLRLKPGQKLADAYNEANLPIVRRQLYQGGVRLAWLLNEAFAE